MRLLAVALLTLLPATAGAVAANSAPVVKGALPPPQSPDCPRTTSFYAFDPSQPVKPRKLDELPPANVYAAVYRRVGNCEVPVIVKYGVGGR